MSDDRFERNRLALAVLAVWMVGAGAVVLWKMVLMIVR